MNTRCRVRAVLSPTARSRGQRGRTRMVS